MQMKDVIVANKTLFIKTSQGPIYSLTPSVRLLQKPIWKNMKFMRLEQGENGTNAKERNG